MYALRYYQQESSDLAVKGLTKANPKPFVIVAATGAGKSLIIADIANRLNGKVLVLQPSQELVQQNYEKLMSYDPSFEVGVYCAGLKRKEIRQVTYAVINSIYRKPELFQDFEYVIIDECHQVNPKNLGGMYTKFLQDINVTAVCGLTATPYRMVQRFYFEDGEKYYTAQLQMINRIFPFFFKSIVYKIETQELIDKGYLSPILYRKIHMPGLDMLEINNTGSDYTEESVRQFWENDVRLEKMASNVQKIDMHCQRSLTFCSSLLQARRAQEMLAEMGIRAEMVDGSTPDKERKRLVAEYKAGEFKHMLNVGVFTTGFDVPELDCVILARPTMSLALYYQMVGRGVRLDPARPEKKLRVYDLVGIVDKLGAVETISIRKEIDPDTGKKTWMDEVVSEAGVMTNVPLFTFKVNKEE